MDDSKIPPPISSGDVTTHLSYMRRDLDQQKIDQQNGFKELKEGMRELKEELVKITDGVVTQKDFAEHIKVDNDHENRIRRLELWGGMAIGGLTLAEFALNYFK